MKRIGFKFILVMAIVVVMAGPGGTGVGAQGPLPMGILRQTENPSTVAVSPQVISGTAALPESPDWKWYIVAGDVFRPASSTMTWTNPAGGCLEPMTAGWWRASVNLPDGSVLTRLDFGFFNDTTSPGSTAYLYHYDGAGKVTTIASGTSLGNINLGTYGFQMIPISNIVVNNREGAYDFVWTGSTAQHLCFLRVGYVPPSIFGTALPLVQKRP
jgi:hypothetical protein